MPLDQPTSTTEKLGHDVRMSFGEHIEALRRRLILSMAGIVIAAIGTFWFGFHIIGWIARPFVQVLDATGFPAHTYVRDPTLGFGIYMKVSLVAAIIVASPWIIWQVWAFIVDGLYEHERRTMHILAPFSALMTILAVLFTRYVLLPISLLFFVNFVTFYPQVQPGEPEWVLSLMLPAMSTAGAEPAATEPGDQDQPPPVQLPVIAKDPVDPGEGSVWINARDGRIKAYFNGQTHTMTVNSTKILAPLPDLGQYIGFAVLMGLGNVAAFQLPVVMLVLGWTSLVDPAEIARMRKYALFVCAALAAILTPADIVSMLVLLIPLYSLFELGLFLMRLTYRRPEYPTDVE